jgi:OmpA-OmpF porin, OOP family
MRSISLAVALATTAISTAAVAKDDFWYTSLTGGPSIAATATHKVGSASVAKIDTGTGFNVAGELGYDFGMFRSGIEVGYQRFGVGNVNNLANLGIIGANGLNADGNGSTRALSFMLNGLFDVSSADGPWGASIGGGIGLAQVKARNYSTGTRAAFVNDSDTGLAWQVLAGLRRSISDNVDLNLGYKFFNAPKVNLIAANGAQLDSRHRSHNLNLGFTYNFGGEAAPAPVAAPAAVAPAPEPAPAVAPAPEPAPAPMPVAAPGPFIIFFDWDKSVITPEAASILKAAAQAYKDTGQSSVKLAGHADKSGTDAYNDALSARRSAAAKAFMVAEGVPADVIGTESFGEGKPLVDTADGVREPQNRRVEITF